MSDSQPPSPHGTPLLSSRTAHLPQPLPVLLHPDGSTPHPWLHSPELLAMLEQLLRTPPVSPNLRVIPAPVALGGDEATLILLHLREIPFLGGILHGYFRQNHGSAFDWRALCVSVQRDESPLRLSTAPQCGTERELLLLCLLSAPVARDSLREELEAIIASVQRSVEDFPAMSGRLRETAALLEQQNHPEEAAFLTWLAGENFILMGLHTLERQEAAFAPAPDASPLGVFRGEEAAARLARVMPGVMEEILSVLARRTPSPLLLEYGLSGCDILYQAGGIDLVAVALPSPPEAPPRLLVLLGRFSRSGLAARPSSIPLLDRKLHRLLEATGAPAGTPLHGEFRSLLQRLPLRELLYGDASTLLRWITRLVGLQESGEVLVDLRVGDPGHYQAVLTAFPRNRNRPDLEREIADLLQNWMGHPVTDQGVGENESLRLVVSYLPHRPESPSPFDAAHLARLLRARITTWEDQLKTALGQHLPPPLAQRLWQAYAHAFDPLYREITPAAEAVEDIAILERMRERQEGFATHILRRGEEKLFIKLLLPRSQDLNTSVGIFSHFGILCRHENGCAVTLPDGASWRIQTFEVGGEPGWKRKLQERARLLGEALAALHAGQLHDDELNRLILLQGLSVREVMLVRGLRQYLLQIRPQLSSAGVSRVLTTHHAMTDLLVRAFLARFDPLLEEEDRREMMRTIGEESATALEEVESLADDQVLRDLMAVIHACVRTNYYQNNDLTRLSFKIDTPRLPGLTGVQPWREIFVLTPEMEGIHLRSAPVARGGIRFSDRREDYRTEVLELMRTQTVKNALIVPGGAKGGFVATRLEEIPPPERPGAVLACYRQFIHGLLELTDNRDGEGIVPPKLCVRHDGADPYLVVAADKGTATFSDHANTLARQTFGFWLGDAFASGGSQGYDHKKIGITARGVWECVRLHFQELGREVDGGHPLTVVGIGDMSGDLFGNGLLMSRNLCLLGAFNHRHIFLDPDPDPLASHRERARLFALPASSWNDYDPRLISPGGGVFERDAKAIPLNGALRELLDVDDDYLSGEEVIRALLQAPVDLLFNGGIGCYVKGAWETPAQILDKANDRVRVDGGRVRARVVAEGGNLGFTQAGRIEYALRGGRINTDALDNAGGVHLSDHEVNLKILLDRLVAQGQLELPDRHALLQRLTGEVVEQVLEAQQAQHLAVSLDRIHTQAHPEALLDGLALLAAQDATAKGGQPSAETLTEWNGRGGIPRPVLAVLLGRSKIFLRQALLASDLVEMFYCERFLTDYFPPSLVREFGAELADHVLRREILATTLANRLLNQSGAGLFLQAWADTARLRGDALPQLIKAYLIVESLLDADAYRADLKNAPVPLATRLEAIHAMEELLWHLAHGMAAHTPPERISTDVIALYGRMIGAFREALWEVLPTLVSPARMELLESNRRKVLERGLPEHVATTLVLLPTLREVMTILRIKESLHVRLDVVGHLFIHVDDALGIHWIEEGIAQGRRRMDRWGSMMQENLRREVAEIRAQLVQGIIAFKRSDESVQVAFAEYLQQMDEAHAAYAAMLAEMRQQGVRDLLPLAVLVSRLRELLATERRPTCL